MTKEPFHHAVMAEPLKPGVSVLIPSYKATMDLVEAIDSVFMQGLPADGFEVLVINDRYPAGDTHAKEMHERVFAEIERRIARGSYEDNVRIISSGENNLNNGPSKARNAGISAARFEFVAGLDADDMYVFDPDYLEEHGSYLQRAMDALSENPDLAYVDCDMYMFGAGMNRPSVNPDMSSEDIHFKRVQALCVSNIAVFRKEDAIAVGGYDTTLKSAEDTHFFVKILGERVKEGKGIELMTLPQPYYLYRQHAEGVERVSSIKEDFDQTSYAAKVVQDGLPYFHHVFGDRPVHEIADMLIKRRDSLIEAGTPWADRSERPERSALLDRMGIDPKI